MSPNHGFHLLILMLLWTCQIHGWSWFSSTDGQQRRIPAKGPKFSLEKMNDDRAITIMEEANLAMGNSNPCWNNAYSKLTAACSEVIADDEKRSRLTWHLSECFERFSGRNVPYCDPGSSMTTCLAKLDDSSLTRFHAFYLASDLKCHHLQSAAFNRETERLVNELKDSAENAEEKLRNIEAVSGLLLDGTNDVQDSLVAISSRAQEVLQKATQVEIQIKDALERSIAIFNNTESIASSQIELKEGQTEMRNSIETGMTALQEHYKILGDGIQKLKDEALAIETEIRTMGLSMSSQMERLQSMANDISATAGLSLEKQNELIHGQSVALEGLNSLTEFQNNSLEIFSKTLQDITEDGRLNQEKLSQQQQQLDKTHDRLIQNSELMIAAQEDFGSKQANMFTTLDKLFTLLNSILLESRFIKTSIHYFGAIIFAYWLTSAKQMSHVRAHFYLGICLIFALEFMVVRFYSLNVEPSWVDANIFWMRSIFLLLLALGLSIYSIYYYRDYEQLNHKMLSSLRDKLEAIERSMNTIYFTLENDCNLSSWVDTELPEDEGVCIDPDYSLPEAVAESSVSSTSSTRKYGLRSRSRVGK